DYKVTGVQTCALPIFARQKRGPEHVGADVLRAAFLAGNDLLLTTAPPDWDKGLDYIGVLLTLSDEKPEYQAKVDTACRRILSLRSEERRAGRACRKLT